MDAHVQAYYEYLDAMSWSETCEGQKRAYANFEY